MKLEDFKKGVRFTHEKHDVRISYTVIKVEGAKVYASLDNQPHQIYAFVSRDFNDCKRK